jgi:hypothetical protein
MFQIPDSFHDFISSVLQRPSHKKAVLTHCHREMMHQVWHLLLNDEFIEAYQHGMVLTCADGIVRRVYPRIFTYSADYPEK